MQPLLTIANVPVYNLDGALCYVAGMAVDADGAPRAYHPGGGGLDALGNAGKPGNWWGLVTGDGTPQGEPVVQGAGDPAPGYYVSSTALCDPQYSSHDPRRYVDSSQVPYISAPPQLLHVGAHKGDACYVYSRETGKCSPAVLADVGPRDKIGEGSIALAEALGIPSSPRSGGCSSGVVYLVFAGTGLHGWPREFRGEAEALLARWGGVRRMVSACL